MYSIGIYGFITMTPEPPVYRQTIQRLVRPGVDGSRLRTLGNQSQPYTATSLRDVLNYAGGRTAFDNYKGLIGTTQILIFNSINFSTAGTPFWVKVIDVVPIQNKYAHPICGGIVSTSVNIIRARWQLEWTPTAP